MKNIRSYTHSDIFYFGLVIMMIGLPLSNFLMSISQLVLAVNWLMEGRIKIKLKEFLKNKTAVVICSFYLLYLVGLLHTSNWEYAFNELRIKLPLFVIPFILASSPSVSIKKFHGLMTFFIGAILLGTLASFGELLGINNDIRAVFGIPSTPLLDIRKISLFISHIRFCLMICLAIFYLLYLSIWEKQNRRLHQLYCFALISWLLTFLFFIESVTSFALTIFIGLALLGHLAWKQKNRWVKMVISGWILIIPMAVVGYLYSMYQEFRDVPPVEIGKLEQFTAQGNQYIHDVDNTQVENGNYIWMYMCKKELKEEWDKRSNYDYHGMDNRNQEIEYTLIRFLASKGVRKDAEGVRGLKEIEIHAIENGIANVHNMRANLHTRIYNIIWEIDDYLRGGNPTGHSLTQRLEYWKTSLLVIRENILIGVGTGDLMREMNKMYNNTGTRLEEGYRKRPHNQYLSIGVSLGLMGLFWFLFTIFFPLYQQPTKRNILYLTFLAIALGSMLTEDTLDTQAGVTFFSFFNALLLFSHNDRH